jgi:signal transduction histidine kinase
MSSSTDRRLLRITGVAAGGAFAAAAASLAGAPAALTAAVTAIAILASGALLWARPAMRGARGRGPREQGELFDHMLDAIDAERETLAHCLHDGPQQTLTAVRLMCDVVRDAVSKGDVHHAEEVLGRLERLAADAADDLRRTVARLHPVVMQQQGLVQALGSLAETVNEEYGVATSFDRPRGGWEAEEDRDTAIFQIAREAAVNAARHGRPPVLISLQRSPADIHLSVEDRGGALNGNGHAPREGVGIRMMRERAARIGAELTLESAPGTRTIVSLHVPAAR